MPGRVLLVDDDPMALRLVAFHLNAAGIETTTAEDGLSALRAVEEEAPSAVVLDLVLPDLSGREVLERLRAQSANLPVVVLTAHGAVDEAVECMRRGACDFVQKPFDETRLVASVRNAMTQGLLRARVETLSRELRGGEGFSTILGRSAAVRRAVELLRRAAQSDVTLLVEGESGTGKEVAARAVHAESTRRDGPFVAVNCGAIPESLVESELFGHEKGAFTGAQQVRKGVFEQADGGTLFLDEIGELRSDLQVRLLRVLQERTVTRVGGASPRRVDVRVIAATNRDVRAEVAKGAFREDVYYRLAVFPVRLPALRERDADVVILSQHFLERFATRHGRRIRGFTADAMAAMQAHAWPGNVRQLENTIERAVILEDGDQISLASLPDELVVAALDRGGAGTGSAAGAGPGTGSAPLVAAPVAHTTPSATPLAAPGGHAGAPAQAPRPADGAVSRPAAATAASPGAATAPRASAEPPRKLMPWEDGFVEPASAPAGAAPFGSATAVPNGIPGASTVPHGHSTAPSVPAHGTPPFAPFTGVAAPGAGTLAPSMVPASAPPAGEIVPLDEMERRAIVHALDTTRGNVQEAAERLGISRATIYRKAERFGIRLR